ncbi:hypothetical protein HII17_05220 [Thalassotalea sp. M1531]|uniref:Methylamine utilization protein n=1 Tax=Thalassotalea algicola TaxID=2716224 RepID=A0A7Y0LB29_9GAMM|nr:hypothetical protein [Thalassotalea algicola]NMP30959.1 hypothetical protein [Thalassotalea algicola]
MTNQFEETMYIDEISINNKRVSFITKCVALLGTFLSTSSYCVNASELTLNVVTPSGSPATDIVSFIRPTKGINGLPLNDVPLYIGQQDKKFAPYITVMQKGQSINFVNHDDITHHIYSVSGENRFEFKIKAGGEITTQPLQSAEEVAMGCNIHDWMSGYVLVVDTPYFGKTNEDGQITFDLPETGEYELSLWHPQLDVTNNRIKQLLNVTQANVNISISLPQNLLPIPEQVGQEDFDFLDEY